MFAKAQTVMETLGKKLKEKLEIAAFDLDADECVVGDDGCLKRRSPSTAKPRLGEEKLMAWWLALDETSKRLPQEVHVRLARAAFPNNSISRERIRAFTVGRKRGPRPSGGKATAE